MFSTAADIIRDIVDALRDSGKFAVVSHGSSQKQTTVPRATVSFEGLDSFLPDDSDSSRWGRLRLGASIHIRSDDVGGGIDRAIDLCTSVTDALLSDPYRNQLCQDLPIGGATEIRNTELVRGMKRPELELKLSIRCHFEIQEQS